MAYSRHELLSLGSSVCEGLSNLGHLHVEGVLQMPLGLTDYIFNRVRAWTGLRILLNSPWLYLLRLFAHASGELLGS